MTIEKLIRGTREEIEKYFSFVGENKTDWYDGITLDRQLDSMKCPMGIVYYLSRKGQINFSKNFIFITDYVI